MGWIATVKVPIWDFAAITKPFPRAILCETGIPFLSFREGSSQFDTHFELETSLEAKGKQALLDELRAIAPPELKLTVIRQHQALGLGHAVHCAAHLLEEGEPFGVILPDVLVKPQPGNPLVDLDKMVAQWQATQRAQIMVEAVPREEVHRYGIVDCGGDEPRAGEAMAMAGVVEKPAPEHAPSRFSVIGRYILPYRVMTLLANTLPGAGGEIQLTDAIERLIRETGVSMPSACADAPSIAGRLRAGYRPTRCWAWKPGIFLPLLASFGRQGPRLKRWTE